MNVSEFLILMVEDDPDQVLFVKRALSKANLINPLRIVSNGESAITYLSGKPPYADRKANPLPSLILLDLRLPRIGGLAVLEWLRAQPHLKGICVAVLTASIDPNDRRKADALGVSAYLCKPVSSEGLLEMMKSIGMYWMILSKSAEVAAPPHSKGDSAKVLLVESDPDSIEALTQGLRRRTPSFQVDAVTTGTEALKELSKGGYAAVVCDQETIGNDPGFATRLKSSRHGVPLLVLASEESEELNALVSTTGADGVVVRQSRLKTFIDVLHRTLAGFKATSQVVEEPPTEPKEDPEERSTTRAINRKHTDILGDQIRFQKTSWDLVRSARDSAGLDTLIRGYWKPLYFFVRQKGFDNETAKDIVQEFLTEAIDRDMFSKADPARGKFRTFLLTALSNSIKDRYKASGRQKRGGGQAILSLDFAAGEREYSIDVASGETPEAILNRAWAQSTLRECIAALSAKPTHLQALRMAMDGTPYLEIAAETGLSEAGVKTALMRLRQQLRELLLERLGEGGDGEAAAEAAMSDFAALLR